jgi:hypothetical protein
MRRGLLLTIALLALASCTRAQDHASYAPYENMISPTTQFGSGAGGGM